MKEVHFVLQGKGGVGKSLISSLLTQFLVAQNQVVRCYDTDPVNQTFSRFQGLNTQQIDILTPHKTVDASKFDILIEQLVEQDGVAVIDNGAATFVPLIGYLRENNVIDFLKANDVNVVVHVPVVGGQASQDTAVGLNSVLSDFDCAVVVWANHFWGNVEQAKALEDWIAIKKHKDRILSFVHLKQYNPDTFGKDIAKMSTEALTMDEAIQSAAFGLMSKQRIKTFKKDIFEQLNTFYQPTGES